MKSVIRKILLEESSKKLKVLELVDKFGYVEASKILGGFDILIKILYDGDVEKYYEDRVRKIINYQTEIQDPENFSDADDYADFCINQGLSFLYEEDEYDSYSWDDYDNGQEYDDRKAEKPVEISQEVILRIEDKMHDEFYEELKDLYDQFSS